MASRLLFRRSQLLLQSRNLRNSALQRAVPGAGNSSIVDQFTDTSKEAKVDTHVANISNELENGIPANGNGTPGINGSYTGEGKMDWSRSYHGLSAEPFPKEAAAVLQAPINPLDIEIKPDGLLYLPEIKYRRILNKAFGPGGWGLAPRSDTNISPKVVSREYALVCLGRLVSVARGEQDYYDPAGIPTATEAVKSNALMRCCKDLGVASELWDPRFIRTFKAAHCVEVFAENAMTKKKKKLWRRKDQPKFDYPWKE